jgi:hypothetical protein
MSSRGIATGFNDTMHATTSVVFGLLVVAMMVLSAVAYRGWFRYYCVATIVVVVGFASGVRARDARARGEPHAVGRGLRADQRLRLLRLARRPRCHGGPP